MHKFSLTTLATCLALAAQPALAQLTPANRSWTGDGLRYTPANAEGCNVTLMEAATRNGRVTVTMRNAGNATLSFTIAGELAGNGQRSIGTANAQLSPGRNTAIPLMRPYNGSLYDSVLTLRGTACSVGS